MPIYVNPNNKPEGDESDYSKPNSAPYLPKGEYQIIKEGKAIASFGSLEEAQRNLSPGAHIKPPNKRAEMKSEQIAVAESVAKNWGKGRLI